MKEKKKHPVLKVIFRTFALILIILLCVLTFLMSAIATVFKGPSDTMKNVLVNTFMETSAMKFIPQMFFSDEEIDTIMRGDADAYNAYISSLKEVEIVIPPKSEDAALEEDPDGDGIIIKDVYGKTYCGKMMIILNPARVSLEIIDTFSETGNGFMLSELAREDGVVAAWNGGGFLDNLGTGNGGMPIGVTIEDGVLRQDYNWSYPTTIGFDKDHKLIVGNMSGAQAIAAGIVNATSFGPVLVKNGVIAPNNGTGLNPRTAIGQRSDGAILVLAIDGRQPHSLGASYSDLSEIMESYGAVNAANLDGGSSSMLFYNGEMINSLGSAVGERRIPTAFIVR